MTKKAKLETFDAVQSERDCYMLAVYDLTNNKVEWGPWKFDESGKMRFGISRVTSYPILFTQWKADRSMVTQSANDNISTGVYYWEKYPKPYDGIQLNCWYDAQSIVNSVLKSAS